jgi:alkylation response protein AidB-like acyl-CoA dehydrogenase
LSIRSDIGISCTLTAEQRELMRDHPVEWMRDAKVFQIVEGTSEIQRHVIASYLRRGDA